MRECNGQNIPPSERQRIWELYLAGTNYAQIAKMTGRSRGVVTAICKSRQASHRNGDGPRVGGSVFKIRNAIVDNEIWVLRDDVLLALEAIAVVIGPEDEKYSGIKFALMAFCAAFDLLPPLPAS